MPVVTNKGAAKKASRKGPDTGPVRLGKKASSPVPPGLYGSKPTGKPLPKYT